MSVILLPTIAQEDWFKVLPEQQRQLIVISYQLYQRESESTQPLTDYGFVVFSMAKAYEGFIKQYLYDLQLISRKTFEGKRFRIGRSINPDVHFNQQDEYWLYDDLERMCGNEVALKIWDTWLECRNQVFHYFPRVVKPISLEAAAVKLQLMADAMASAYQCQLDNS